MHKSLQQVNINWNTERFTKVYSDIFTIAIRLFIHASRISSQNQSFGSCKEEFEITYVLYLQYHQKWYRTLLVVGMDNTLVVSDCGLWEWVPPCFLMAATGVHQQFNPPPSQCCSVWTEKDFMVLMLHKFILCVYCIRSRPVNLYNH